MALRYHQAPLVAVGDKITSQDYNKLALAFNDRLKNGVGDPGWRIIWYVHSIFRNVRNRISNEEFPDEDEWWKLWSHLDGKYGTDNGILWPSAMPGEEGGLSVVNGLMGWLFGRVLNPDGSGLPSEPARMNAITLQIPAIPAATSSIESAMESFELYFYPNYVDVLTDVVDADSLDVNGARWGDTFGQDLGVGDEGHNPITPAERWLLGIWQRGAYDPSGGIDAPAYSSPREFYNYRQPIASPYLKTYSSYVPVPPIRGYCSNGPDLPPTPIYDITFTNLEDGSTITYLGKCPGTEGSLVGIFEFDEAYYVYKQVGSNVVLDNILPISQWIEGPYNSGAIISKQHGEQIDQSLNYFALNFRGSIEQRGTDGCFDVKQVGFNFEKFLNTQYLLSPAFGIAFEVPGETEDESITLVREVYPRWSLENEEVDPVIHPAGKILDCKYISSVTTDGEGNEIDEYTETSDEDKEVHELYQVSGIYIHADGLDAGIECNITITAPNSTIQIPLTTDENGRINETVFFNTPEYVAPITTYNIALASGVTFNTDSYLRVDVLEQLIGKPSLPDIYTVLRMSTCEFDVISAGLDNTGPYFENSPAIFEVYYNYGYIPTLVGALEMDSYDILPHVNPRAIYEVAREFFHKYTRMADRHQLTGYEVAGGKSILYFRRFVWPEDMAHDLPAPMLGAIAIQMPRGEVLLELLEDTGTLEDGVTYVLRKTGTMAPNSSVRTGPLSSTFIADEAAYAGVVYVPYTEGSYDGLIVGNTTEYVEEHTVDNGLAQDIPSLPSPFGVLFATGIPQMSETFHNGYSWKIERRIKDETETVLEDWTVVANGAGYSPLGASYVYSEENSFTFTAKWAEYRFTGTPEISKTGTDLVLYKKVQGELTAGATYEVRSVDNPVYDGIGTPTTLSVGVVYPPGSGIIFAEGDTFIASSGTDYEITTGHERVYKLELDGIVEDNTYVVKGTGYVTYPAGSVNQYHEGDTFTGGATSTYNISDTKTYLYDISGKLSESARQGFDVFEGIAPSRDVVDFTGIKVGVTYKVSGTTGTVEYNGTSYSSGDTFVGVADVDDEPINVYTVDPIDTADVRAYALTGGVWSEAPKKGYSNEWQMFCTFSTYHPSETSMWNAGSYSDELGFLHNRCHLYSPDLIENEHSNLNHQFTYGMKPVFRSEAPSGYTYLEQTHNASFASWGGCDEDDTASTCDNKQIEGIKNFYRSCEIYKKDYEIESVELTDIDGEVKVTLKNRLQTTSAAPDVIAKESITDALTENIPLKSELYRTDENGIREYIRCIATNCVTSGAGGVQCSRYKIGDYAPNSILPFIPDNPFGACFPRFYFVKKVPYVYAEPIEPEDEAGIPELDQDTRRDVDPFTQMEFYLRAFAPGFIDSEGTKEMNCSVSDGTSRMIDYTFPNLVYQATWRVEATEIDAEITEQFEESFSEPVEEVFADMSIDSSYTISWTAVTGPADYKIQRRELQGDSTYSAWEEIATVEHPGTMYIDVISSEVSRSPVIRETQYKVLRGDTSAELVSNVETVHTCNWNLSEDHVYVIQRREDISFDLSVPDWTDWADINPVPGEYEFPGFEDNFNLTEEERSEIQYRVRQVNGFRVTWPATINRVYRLQRKIIREHDSDNIFQTVTTLRADSDPEVYIDDPPLGVNNYVDSFSSAEPGYTEVAVTATPSVPLTVTPNDVADLVVVENGDYTHSLSWTHPGVKVHILRRYNSGGAMTDWIRTQVVNVEDPSSVTDFTILQPPFITDVQYKVQYITQDPPLLEWTAEADKWYKVTRTITDINGKEAIQDLPNQDQDQYIYSTGPASYTDPIVITPLVASIDYKVYKRTGYTVSWSEVETNAPGLSYTINRIVDDTSVTIGTYPLEAGTLEHFDEFTEAEGSVVKYKVETSWEDPIKSIEYVVLAMNPARNRWISSMPVSKRIDRPKGFGPLPYTCMHAAMFNVFSNSINLLTQARIDLPFDFECQTTSTSNTYPVSLDCRSGRSGIGNNPDSNFGACSAVDEEGTCADTEAFNSTPGLFTHNVYVRNFPINHGGEAIISPWAICTGMSASKSANIIETDWVCSGCTKKIGGITSKNDAQMRVKPDAYSKYAMNPELRALAESRGLGFFGEITTIKSASRLVAVETPTDACTDVDGDSTAYMACGDQYLMSQETVPESAIETTECKFFGGTASLSSPTLLPFDAGIFGGATAEESGGGRAVPCGGSLTSQSLDIPDLSQFVTLVTVPTIE